MLKLCVQCYHLSNETTFNTLSKTVPTQTCTMQSRFYNNFCGPTPLNICSTWSDSVNIFRQVCKPWTWLTTMQQWPLGSPDVKNSWVINPKINTQCAQNLKKQRKVTPTFSCLWLFLIILPVFLQALKHATHSSLSLNVRQRKV